MQKVDVTGQILKFREFLLDSWSCLDSLMANHDWDEDVNFMDDWIQINWEFLVERQLLQENERLKPYSSFFPESRITYPSSKTTHLIVCSQKENKNLFDYAKGQPIIHKELVFSGFVNKMNPGFGCYPPFNYVTGFTLDKKSYYRLFIEDVSFYLVSI